MKAMYFNIPVLCLFLCLLPTLAAAVDVAPRISDREIIESLAEIKAQLAAHDKRFDAIDKRFDEQNNSINQRFDEQNISINQRFNDQNKSINQRFDEQSKSINQRFDDINLRISDNHKTMLAFFAAIVSLIIAIFAYIAWDRRTMMQPMRQRIETLEQSVNRDLDLDNVDGSRITRLLAALRELAKTDAKLETVLRNFSLL